MDTFHIPPAYLGERYPFSAASHLSACPQRWIGHCLCPCNIFGQSCWDEWTAAARCIAAWNMFGGRAGAGESVRQRVAPCWPHVAPQCEKMGGGGELAIILRRPPTRSCRCSPRPIIVFPILHCNLDIRRHVYRALLIAWSSARSSTLR